MKKIVFFGLFFLVVLVSGCTSSPQNEDKYELLDIVPQYSEFKEIILRAEQTKNVDLCEEVDNGYGKSLCVNWVAVAAKNSLLCNRLEEGGFRDNCFNYFAVEFNNENICEDINHDYSKSFCYLTIAVNKKDLMMCDKAKSHIQDCYKDIAAKTENPSLCESEKLSEQKRNECYKQLAQKTGNPELCKKIQEEKALDTCYLLIAIKKNDISFCEKIKDQTKKNTCIQNRQ